MPDSLIIVRAELSARTLKPMIRAFDAIASVTSDSVMPPTPLDTTLTATSSVDSFDSESRSASALPCTSALMTTCTVADFAIAHLRQHVFELRRALPRELGVAELALAIQRDFARLALAFDHQQLVARIRRARQAEHHDRHRRTGFGHRLAALVEHRTHAAEFLAGDDLDRPASACRA